MTKLSKKDQQKLDDLFAPVYECIDEFITSNLEELKQTDLQEAWDEGLFDLVEDACSYLDPEDLTAIQEKFDVEELLFNYFKTSAGKDRSKTTLNVPDNALVAVQKELQLFCHERFRKYKEELVEMDILEPFLADPYNFQNLIALFYQNLVSDVKKEFLPQQGLSSLKPAVYRKAVKQIYIFEFGFSEVVTKDPNPL